MKTKYTEIELAEIAAIQEQRDCTRKNAVRVFEKGNRRIILTAAAQPVVDVKMAAANDEQPVTTPATTEAAPTTEAPKAAKKVRAPKAPVVKLTAEQVSAARKEGIRLFHLAGRPTKEQFVLVYGENGHKMTWDARAKAGVPAEKFREALAAKQSH